MVNFPVWSPLAAGVHQTHCELLSVVLQTGAECIRFRRKWGCNLQSVACVLLSSRRRSDPTPHPHADSFCMCFESYRNNSHKVTWITSNQFWRRSMQRFVRIKSLFSDMAFRKTRFDGIQSSRHFANCRGTRALKMLYELSSTTMAVFAVCVSSESAMQMMS